MTSSVGSLVPTSIAAVSRKTNDDEPSAKLSRAPRFSFGDVSRRFATRPPDPTTLGPPWRAPGAELHPANRDATLLWLKEQEDAGVDIVSDGEQSRQHFVHGFLEQVEGIDFEHKVKMGIRDNRYDAMVPQVVAPLRLKGRVHQAEALVMRNHATGKIKMTMPGPMTIVDTVADRHYGDKVKLAMAFAELLNQEARALQKDGVDVIQFD